MGFWKRDEIDAIRESNPDLADATDAEVRAAAERARVEQERKLGNQTLEDQP